MLYHYNLLLDSAALHTLNHREGQMQSICNYTSAMTTLGYLHGYLILLLLRPLCPYIKNIRHFSIVVDPQPMNFNK